MKMDKNERKTIKALETTREMIVQRGFKLSDPDDEKIIGTNKDGERIIIFTKPVSKFNIDRVKEYISCVHNMNMNHCIVIYVDSITPMAKKLVENSTDITIELFTRDELQYNITNHRLVPSHIKLSDNDAKNFKTKYGLKFPTILQSDPVARFYYFRRGDVVKIVRNNDGVPYITHRIVKG